jgi:hypothetical protein
MCPRQLFEKKPVMISRGFGRRRRFKARTGCRFRMVVNFREHIAHDPARLWGHFAKQLHESHFSPHSRTNLRGT